MNTSSQPPQPDDADLPPALRKALRELNGSSVPVPEALDQAILEEAKSHLEKSSPISLFSSHPALQWVAAAAALVMAACLAYFYYPTLNQRLASPPKLEDLDRNGLVDIRDAFWLARKLETDPSALDPSQYDMNHDGSVDQQDVDAIAYQSVALEKKS